MKIAFLCKTRRDVEFQFQKYLNEIPFGKVEKIMHNRQVKTTDGDEIIFMIGEIQNIRGYRLDKIYVQRGIDLEIIGHLVVETGFSILLEEDRISYFD